MLDENVWSISNVGSHSNAILREAAKRSNMLINTMLDKNVWSVSRGLLILLGLAGYLKQCSPISAKIYSDICPWTLSVPRGEQLVNLQRFYDVPFASIYRDFMMPVSVNLQIFHDAPLASIYRDFMMPRLRQFTEISWCPVCVNLQRDFMMPVCVNL